MVQWCDEAIILARRAHGEHGAILSLLAQDQGRCGGFIHGARKQAMLQPGAVVWAQWRARRAEQLGTLRCELRCNHIARVMDDPCRLEALAAALVITQAVLAERDPQPRLFSALSALLGVLPDPDWAVAYLRWEWALLTDLGFGFHLPARPRGGEGLRLFVQPHHSNGRWASSLSAPWWPLPLFLLPKSAGALFLPPKPAGERNADPADAAQEALADAFRLNAAIFEARVFAALGTPLPAARRRLTVAFDKRLAVA